MVYLARVMTKWGNAVHLAKVPTRNRPFTEDGLVTLCGKKVFNSLESCSDVVSCPHCLKIEKLTPIPRRE